MNHVLHVDFHSIEARGEYADVEIGDRCLLIDENGDENETLAVYGTVTRRDQGRAHFDIDWDTVMPVPPQTEQIPEK